MLNTLILIQALYWSYSHLDTIKIAIIQSTLINSNPQLLTASLRFQDRFMFQNLPTISALAHPLFATCLRFQDLKIVGKLRYHIERQLKKSDKLRAGTVCCITVWFNHFLNSKAEICQIFALVFWKICNLYQINFWILSVEFQQIFGKFESLKSNFTAYKNIWNDFVLVFHNQCSVL